MKPFDIIGSCYRLRAANQVEAKHFDCTCQVSGRNESTCRDGRK